jgi:hypothetical protein
MMIAGHADIKTTMEVYQHIPGESVREAMDKVQEVFGEL